MTPLKIVLISIVLPLIYACSHPIEIEGDGYVWSTDGRTCRMEGDDPGKTNCSKNLVLGEYHTTYYAEPRDNWKFDYWEIYCEEAIDNSCSFSASKAAVQKFWFKTVPPLHAVFSPLDTDIDGLLDDVDPCPLNPNSSPCAVITTADTIAVAGKKWAQPDLFTGVSWNTLNGVCPGGVCGNSATLNGKDLSGWTWASVDDLNDLFNVYIAPAAIGPGPARYEFINSTVTPAVFAPPQGLRATDSDLNFNRVKAWTSTEAPGGAYYGFVYDGPSDDNDIFATDELVSPDTADLVVGAWFYRAPDASVTLANLNVLHGFDCDSPEVNTEQCRVSERIALLRDHLIAAGCPDLVSLQEVINAEFAPTAEGQPVASILLLIEAELPNLAAACGFTYRLVYEPHLTPPLKISETDEEVILSRYPVLQTGTRILYGPLVKLGIFARHVLYARVDHPSGEVDVYTTHLASGGDFATKICGAPCPVECDNEDTVRACQAEQLALYVEQTRGANNLALISGDFNAVPGSTEYQTMTSRGWLDSHLAAGQPECDSTTGIGCSSGRNSSLEDIERLALNVSDRIDYIFVALPQDNNLCTSSRQSGQQQATLGAYEIESAGLFADKPNLYTQTCGSSPNPLCWVSDHSGNQARLLCRP